VSQFILLLNIFFSLVVLSYYSIFLTQGNKCIYKPHWGEQLVGKHQPVVAVLDTIPDELSLGRVIWTKDQDVIGVAWKHGPLHLGLTACTNRYSWIFLLKNGEYRKEHLNN
jgi:acylaminoacyl-peptidase